MNLKLPAFLALVGLTFASCSNRVYAPAMYHQDIAYQPKPVSFDSVKSASYAAGGIGINLNPTSNDALYSAQFNISRGHVFDHVNLAYGAFGVIGDYENSTIQSGQPYYFQDKFFGAGGARASANLFVNNGNVDFRYFGVEMVYSHEFGDYASFRKTVSQSGLPDFYTDNRVDLFSAGVTSEVTWRAQNKPKLKHSIRIFAGTTFGNNNLDNTYYKTREDNSIPPRNVVLKASYFLQFNNYTAGIDAGYGVFFRFGYCF